MSNPLPPRALELVETHRNYAHALAGEILQGLPSHVLREDIEAAAELGLVEAAAAFDPTRGVLFKTFAYYRIRGAIYDGIRKATWFSKSMYDRYRFQMAANDVMSDYAETGATEAGPEGALREAQFLTESVASCYLLSLEAHAIDQADTNAVSAEQALLDQESRSYLRRALERLPEKSRRVIEGYYFEGRTLEEVGAGLGLSKSWICRVHAKALESLREAMLELMGEQATEIAGAR
ncbi:MAG: sigma-70 family RNA polymerase sigma factor [Bryobacteraceae bacterium]|nr:sigma-70 family RNA polymerase sigma factor [Bryobacteraceae bacterium]